ncbi:MAG: head GIN domain-containing protein [Salinibacter sp.]|uniref:head GIN domain-containing protein n=1 Tax=Salinibacter sp. TaxID=2065818 RepID=UPI0035D4C3A3
MLSLPSAFLRAALLGALLALPVHLVSAQDRVRESRSVDAFAEVEYNIPGTLHLRQGDDRSVEVSAPETVLDEIKTTVDGETLEISDGDEPGLLELFGADGLDTDQIDVYVTAPTLHELNVAGTGRAVGETTIEGKALTLRLAGSGELDVEVETNELSLQMAGSGTGTLRGQTRTLDLNIAGSGNLQGASLTAQRADVQIAGSGDAKLNVTGQLSAQIFGSGDVRYRGEPTVETNMLGSGEVNPIE